MRAKKGVITFIRGQCANYQDGHCLGINITDDLKNELFREPGKCLISEGKPCRYFERCVLGPARNPHHEPGYDYEALFEQYARINPAYLSKTVKVRRCECGEPLAKGKQRCEKCRKQKARESGRERQRQHRKERRKAS